MNRVFILIFTILQAVACTAQMDSAHFNLYQEAFTEIKLQLEGKREYNFKKAVFLTENAYTKGKLDYNKYCSEIKTLADKLNQIVRRKNIQQYKTALNYAAFSFMTDSIPENNFQPYVYDFDDFLGSKNYENMFVSKLMRTKGGNCHSLPYFYKIICEEAGVQAHLAIAPNHCYIKHKDEYGKWANIELTNISTPVDQWYIAQMNVSADAIRNGSYMKPLNNQETLAFCLFDLASCYELQFGFDDFYLEMVNEGLKYYPNSIELTMKKVNYYVHFGNQARKEHRMIEYQYHQEKYNQYVRRINELGYMEETPEQYEEWVKSVEEEKARLENLKTNSR